MGINIIDIGLSTTPTTQIIVQKKKAEGGIILTASHNPKNWNALKLFNSRGEFLIEEEAEEIFRIVEEGKYEFMKEDDYGKIHESVNSFQIHIDEVKNLKLVNCEKIINKNLKRC